MDMKQCGEDWGGVKESPRVSADRNGRERQVPALEQDNTQHGFRSMVATHCGVSTKRWKIQQAEDCFHRV